MTDIILHAQPYDISATGFYFDSLGDYEAKAKANRNDYGDEVEEYEIQFIDGDTIDCELAKAWGLNQANFVDFLEYVEGWEDWEKVNYIIAVGEGIACHDSFISQPDHVDMTVYECDNMRDLAQQFVDEGLFGDIPERIEHYLDFDAIARDLSMDHAEITIAGTHYIYHSC